MGSKAVRRRRARGFIDLYESMQADDDVSDPGGLDQLENDVASNGIARAIASVGVICVNSELGDGARAGAEGRGETGEDTLLGRGRL